MLSCRQFLQPPLREGGRRGGAVSKPARTHKDTDAPSKATGLVSGLIWPPSSRWALEPGQLVLESPLQRLRKCHPAGGWFPRSVCSLPRHRTTGPTAGSACSRVARTEPFIPFQGSRHQCPTLSSAGPVNSTFGTEAGSFPSASPPAARLRVWAAIQKMLPAASLTGLHASTSLYSHGGPGAGQAREQCGREIGLWGQASCVLTLTQPVTFCALGKVSWPL